jgi:signal transduction histidine kinase
MVYFLAMAEEVLETNETVARLRLENESLRRKLLERSEELISARNELSVLDRMRRDFITLVSHELRTPLTSVVGMSDLISHGLYEWTDDLHERMKTISTEASVLSRLVDDMIEFLQWASGQMAMKKDVVDLCSHVDETVKRVHGRYADKNLRITTPGLERLEISADAHSLQGCLERVVDNAMKFSYPEGKVDVRVESTVANGKSVALVIVRDRGQGIASENLQELYKVRPCAAPTRTTPAAAA